MVPTSVAPITFFARDDAEWMLSRQGGISGEGMKGLSLVSKDVLDFLKARGASFFADIVRGTRQIEGRSGERALGIDGGGRDHGGRL